MRSRLLKPGFFQDEDLTKLHPMARLLFAGLWCLADREGRLEDRPRLTSSQIFPYEDDLTVEQVNEWLDQLSRTNSDDKPCIIRYEVGGKRYIQITNFTKHQQVHPREMKSVIPAPAKPGKPKAIPEAEPKDSQRQGSVPEITSLSPSEAEVLSSEPSEALSSEAASSVKHNPTPSVLGPVAVPERHASPPPPPKVERKPNPPGNNAPALRRYRPEAIAAVATMLETWTEGLLGKPDRQICEIMLLTIGGDSDEYLESMREWFLAIRRAGKSPHGIQGWGWFPRVLAADLKALEERDKPQGGVA